MTPGFKISHKNGQIKNEQGFLLDTHTFIWAAQEPEKLGVEARQIVEDPANTLYLSSISAFELTNKYRIGKLPECDYLVSNYTQIARQLGTVDLPITLAHTWFAGQFEWGHRDPFDRILAAQAAMENLILVSNDKAFDSLDYYELAW